MITFYILLIVFSLLILAIIITFALALYYKDMDYGGPCIFITIISFFIFLRLIKESSEMDKYNQEIELQKNKG